MTGSASTRGWRVQDIVLVDHPADKEAPRLICVYLVDLFDARNGGKEFKFDPECMLYAYEWLHKAEPADFRPVLAKDPAVWFGHVTTWLLGALNREAPHLFKALHADSQP